MIVEALTPPWKNWELIMKPMLLKQDAKYIPSHIG